MGKVAADDLPIFGIPGPKIGTFIAPGRPNERWVDDTTAFPIGSSAKLYLAGTTDLHTRFIVGRAVSTVNDRHRALRARQSARAPVPAAGLLHQFNQGCTYAGETIARASTRTK